MIEYFIECEARHRIAEAHARAARRALTRDPSRPGWSAILGRMALGVVQRWLRRGPEWAAGHPERVSGR